MHIFRGVARTEPAGGKDFGDPFELRGRQPQLGSSKENLFAVTLDRELTAMAQAVPVDVDDLAGWVGRLFDYHREHPSGVRISLWRELERPDLGPDDARVYAEKVHAIAPSTDQRATAIDLLVLLYGMAQSWFFTPMGLRRVDGCDPLSDDRIRLHRSVLIAVASALVDKHRDL